VTDAIAQLLSRSCTTGWRDWSWGELLLFPDGLARIGLGRSGTYPEAIWRRKRGGGPTVPAAPPETKSFGEGEVHQLINADRRNRWIPRDDVRRARLRQGVLNSSLVAELGDESRVKLLWLKSDPAFDVLRTTLGEWLGDDLEVA
jgi:hypothetical protein